MATGLYQHTTRAAGTLLTATLYNSAHRNHQQHAIPSSTGAHADTLAMFRAMTDPAPSAIPTPVTALGTELEQLRFVVADIKTFLNGGVPPTRWYTPVAPAIGTLITGHGARAFRASGQNIPNGRVDTAISFSGVRYDTGVLAAGYDNFWGGALLPTRLVAPVDGLYAIGGSVGWTVVLGQAGALSAVIRLNGVEHLSASQMDVDPTLVTQLFSTTTQVLLAAGDYVELVVFQASTTNPLVVPASPEMWIELLNATAGIAPAPVATAVFVITGPSGPSAGWTPGTTNLYFPLGDPTNPAPTPTVGKAQKRLPMSLTVTQLQGALISALAAGDQGAIRFNVNGAGNNGLVMAFGTPTRPTATAVVTTAGAMDPGIFHYKVTFVINGFENADSTISFPVTTDAAHTQVQLSALATYAVGTTGAQVTRNIYRTQANGGTYFFLASLPDNTTTLYLDMIPDAGLGAAYAPSLFVGSPVGTLALAQDDLVCFEATGVVGTTHFTLGAMTMTYTAPQTAGFLVGRAAFSTALQPLVTPVFASISTLQPSADLAAAWVTKPVRLARATLTADAAPGAGTNFTVQATVNDGAAFTGLAVTLVDAATSVGAGISGDLPGTTTGVTADDSQALYSDTSAVTTNLRPFFAYRVAAPDRALSFYHCGQPGFNHAGLSTVGGVFAPIAYFGASTGFITPLEGGAQLRWPIAGTFKYLGAKLGTTAGTVGRLALRVNNADTAIATTFSGVTAWYQLPTTGVHVNAGDLVNYQFTRVSGAGNDLDANICLGFLPD